MREYGCKNCGKKIIRTTGCGNQRYCSPKCKVEFEKKKQMEAAKNRHILTPPKTPEEQCERCLYGCAMGGMFGCGYFDFTWNTCRTLLHPEGLPDECQEYKPRIRQRKPKSAKLL